MECGQKCGAAVFLWARAPSDSGYSRILCRVSVLELLQLMSPEPSKRCHFKESLGLSRVEGSSETAGLCLPLAKARARRWSRCAL